MAVTTAQHQYRDASRSRAWIEGCTTASVGLLAVIAAVVSYGHMHALALQHGEGAAASALIPLSVDGMIVAASMSLLLDSRLGRRGGMLPWVLLVTGAAASLAANIAAAEPTAAGRVIAAWPSFALTASYELLMRQSGTPHTRPIRQCRRPGQPGQAKTRLQTHPSRLRHLAGPGRRQRPCLLLPRRAGGWYSGGRGNGR